MNFDRTQSTRDPPGLLSISTLVLWLGCLLVGLLGFLLPYPWPRPPPKEPTPVIAQVMHVQLTEDSSIHPDDAPPILPGDVSQPPDTPLQIAAPAAPALISVAAPSPSIAFSLPTSAPSHIVEAKQAIPRRTEQIATTQPASTASATPQRLTYGQGEGIQPAPQYPREAVLARQQGTVTIRFTVGADGRVQTAQAISPCPFPLLNQAAVRAVRETWRFRAGPVRSYEVSIQFQLREKS
jgi:protein TonB